jgi:hypothetical protein
VFKKTCATCHYFIRVHHLENGTHHAFEVSRDHRERTKNGDLSWQRESESICCHRGIWDEGLGFPESSKLEQASTINRRNKCYYLPYQPGMLLPAAEKLQDARINQTRELQKIRFAVYGLALTIIGLIVKLITDQP